MLSYTKNQIALIGPHGCYIIDIKTSKVIEKEAIDVARMIMIDQK
jgi:hypothetical protein